MKVTSHSLLETEAFAKRYLGAVKPQEKGAFIVGLYGNLGSGKTAFTQALARLLGIAEPITSPTFVIEKIYPLLHSLSAGNTATSEQFFTHLIHIDAYRLESSEEMRHLGWDEIIGDRHNLIVIEWPERIADILPADHARLQFTFIDETTREIEVVQ